ncbi:MAG: hypothetical protein FWG54_02175, partial [Bacteroidetes bacterium]|nr:hypothetical protein [Bacteroidota bacterium]
FAAKVWHFKVPTIPFFATAFLKKPENWHFLHFFLFFPLLFPIFAHWELNDPKNHRFSKKVF